MISRLFLLCSIILSASLHADEWISTELRRYSAPEAKQGVAVDQTYFYVIDNRQIAKYRKDTGEKIAHWEDEKGGRFIHLNAGIVIDDKLYCAHSNFPILPDVCSVEIWDTATMKHVKSVSLPDPPGSLTWAIPHKGLWYTCFAHYKKRNGSAAGTRVVSYDADWKPLSSWTFPADLIEQFRGGSSSGGGFDEQGRLFVSGHDEKELYLIELPTDSRELHWITRVPVTAPGQAFVWDFSPSQEGAVWGIDRKAKEVVVSRVVHKTP